MREIRVAAAQFEHRDRNPEYNLTRIRELTRHAVDQGAEIVSFHECSISAYTWVQPLSREALEQVAEPVPDGPSTRKLIEIAREFRVVVMAGLFERDPERRIYNCYVCVGPDGFVTKFRKLHTFISPHLTPGDRYEVIDLLGCKVGFLICYDNNLPENVRMTTLLGAEIHPLSPSLFPYRRNPLRCKHKRRGLLGNDQPPGSTLGEPGGWAMGHGSLGNGGGGPPRVAARIIYIPLPDFLPFVGPGFVVRGEQLVLS